MKEFVEKIIEKLEDEHERCVNRYGVVGGNAPASAVQRCIRVVEEMAEEHENDFCEWKGESALELYNSSCGQKSIVNPFWGYCPYCGKKIKVVD